MVRGSTVCGGGGCERIKLAILIFSICRIFVCIFCLSGTPAHHQKGSAQTPFPSSPRLALHTPNTDGSVAQVCIFFCGMAPYTKDRGGGIRPSTAHHHHLLRHFTTTSSHPFATLPLPLAFPQKFNDAYDDYIVVAFINATLVLSIGDTVEEVTDSSRATVPETVPPPRNVMIGSGGCHAQFRPGSGGRLPEILAPNRAPNF